jgi:hypothetical protein
MTIHYYKNGWTTMCGVDSESRHLTKLWIYVTCKDCRRKGKHPFGKNERLLAEAIIMQKMEYLDFIKLVEDSLIISVSESFQKHDKKRKEVK